MAESIQKQKYNRTTLLNWKTEQSEEMIEVLQYVYALGGTLEKEVNFDRFDDEYQILKKSMMKQ